MGLKKIDSGLNKEYNWCQSKKKKYTEKFNALLHAVQHLESHDLFAHLSMSFRIHIYLEGPNFLLCPPG